MIHRFTQPTAHIARPSEFTYPFCYVPHPLVLLAAEQLQTYIAGQRAWQEELAGGKMFGVLVVADEADELGFLAAFSGNLAGRNDHPYFVPAVYDMLQHDGFFKVGERELIAINQEIKALETSEAYLSLKTELHSLEADAKEDIARHKAEFSAAKQRRDALRKSGTLSADALSDLIAESQFQKAEQKRTIARWHERITYEQQKIEKFETEIKQLKATRHTRSKELQQQIFRAFRMLNARGEERDLIAIFDEYVGKEPPAGAGECAAPKLLQEAYCKGLTPLAMGEFWWGASPRGAIRHHGTFYPSCRSKCYPILGWMLRGLNVAPNPMLTEMQRTEEVKTLYEDEDLMVIAKPAGMLSVAGKEDAPSVESIMRNRFPDADHPLIVHRLDMATSGLLVIAKTKAAHQDLQAQFAARTVRKRYMALLDGIVPADRGTITLPLCLDPDDRPRQMVHPIFGKPAETRFEVISRTQSQTRIALYPVTGRTHQLRVHMAHKEGLGCPIVGDTLYGTPSTRLMLHAEWIEFRHPRTRKLIAIEYPAEF